MTNYDLDISCLNSVPNPITVKAGDTVTFNNTTGTPVEVKFSGSDAFKPKKSKIDIPSPGSHTLTIGGDKKATTYKWKCPATPELATRTGRIDPS